MERRPRVAPVKGKYYYQKNILFIFVQKSTRVRNFYPVNEHVDFRLTACFEVIRVSLHLETRQQRLCESVLQYFTEGGQFESVLAVKTNLLSVLVT